MPEGFADQMKAGGEAYERGDLAMARSHFEAALALEPGSTVARYNLGVVFRDLEMSEDAWMAFLEVIAHDGRAWALSTTWRSSRSGWRITERPRSTIGGRSR